MSFDAFNVNLAETLEGILRNMMTHTVIIVVLNRR